MNDHFVKDPDAILDYGFDWKDKSWLAETETITSYVITVPDDLILENDHEADGIITVWLSGGVIGREYIVACKITTGLGRTDERSIYITIADR